MTTQLELKLEDEFLTAVEVAKILGVTSAAVGHWCKDGDFPGAYKLNPNRIKSSWRIPRSAVNAFIEMRRDRDGYFRMPVAG